MAFSVPLKHHYEGAYPWNGESQDSILGLH